MEVSGEFPAPVRKPDKPVQNKPEPFLFYPLFFVPNQPPNAVNTIKNR